MTKQQRVYIILHNDKGEIKMKERSYIFYRKVKASLNKLCFYLCSIFPIKNKLISVCTFEGKGGFGCNPKYIVEELHRRNPNYEFVWFVNDMSKEFPNYIKKVPNTLWSRAYWLSRSKVWIDNYRKPYGTRKRKGQIYINTWHATIGFKSIGLWRGDAFSKMAYLVSQNDSKMIDRVVIDSEWCAEMYPNGMVYDGDFLWAGAPRCDALYGDRKKYKDAFCKKHGISRDSKIVMFAPTFREGSKNGKRTLGINDINIFPKWAPMLVQREMISGQTFGGGRRRCCLQYPLLGELGQGWERQLKGACESRSVVSHSL